MAISRHFYETILQRKVKFDFGENITFHGDFAIHLDTHFKTLIENKEIRGGGNNFELYFEEDDMDQVMNMLKSNGVELVHEMREQPWRQRVVRFYDPDQYIIEIGESLEFLCFRLQKEGLSNDVIASTIGLTEAFVSDSIMKFQA